MSRIYAMAGGGTLGPVTPLLAVASKLEQQEPDCRILWFGTQNGPERPLVEALGYEFIVLPVARLPRYVSFEWVIFPWNMLRACWKAFSILKKHRVSLVAMAGGFSGVPVVFAAKYLSLPIWVHQPDVLPLLSTRIVAPFATWFTVSFPESIHYFPKRHAEVVGNPVRAHLLKGEASKAVHMFRLREGFPTLLVFGGGGGARWINEQLLCILPEVCRIANVIHITGKGQKTPHMDREGYVAKDLLHGREMAHAWAAADLVLMRAGMGSLSEMSATQTPAILVPLPGSQSANAAVFAKASAAHVLSQALTTPDDLLACIKDLLRNRVEAESMAASAQAVLRTDGAEEIAHHLRHLLS